MCARVLCVFGKGGEGFELEVSGIGRAETWLLQLVRIMRVDGYVRAEIGYDEMLNWTSVITADECYD